MNNKQEKDKDQSNSSKPNGPDQNEDIKQDKSTNDPETSSEHEDEITIDLGNDIENDHEETPTEPTDEKQLDDPDDSDDLIEEPLEAVIVEDESRMVSRTERGTVPHVVRTS